MSCKSQPLQVQEVLIDTLTNTQLNHLVALTQGATWHAKKGYIWPTGELTAQSKPYVTEWDVGISVIESNWVIIEEAFRKKLAPVLADAAASPAVPLFPLLLKCYLKGVFGSTAELPVSLL